VQRHQGKLSSTIRPRQIRELQVEVLHRYFWLVVIALLVVAGRAYGQANAEGTADRLTNSKSPVAVGSSDSAATRDQASSPPVPQRPIHIVPFGPPAQPSKTRPLAQPTSSNQGQVQYWGGPVISNVNVVEVLWGSFVDGPSTTGLDQFFTDVTTSSYFGLLAEYSTVGLNGNGAGSPPGSNQIIGPGTFGGKFTINPSICPGGATNPACTINDNQIQSELVSQVNASHLPQPTQDPQGNFNTIYMIYFPPGVTIVLAPGVDSCRIGGFCAYHSNVLTGNKLPYGVFPDFGPTSGCSAARGGCGLGTSQQNLSSASSHELGEAVTDVDVGTATDFAPPLAWADQTTGQEIGDFCNGISAVITANGNMYTVQTQMSNMQNGCVSAPAHFQVTAPANAVPGRSFNVKVAPQTSVNNFSIPAYNDAVTFTSSDPSPTLPADYTFVPATDQGTHTFPVTLNALGSQTVSVNDKVVTAMVGSVIVNVADNPDLAIVSSHVGNFTQGDTGDTYTLTVTNVGDRTTTSPVTVTDNLPFGLTATAVSGTGWSCSFSASSATCSRSDTLIALVAYPAITLTVSVSNTATTPLVNSAQVSGGGEVNTDNDTFADSTVVIQLADLIVSSSHSGSFSQGQVGETYNLLVQNTGNGPTTGVVSVTDTLPIHLTGTAISGTGWTCVLASLTCTRSDVLGSNGLAYPPVTVTVNVDAATPIGTVFNTATVAGGGEVIVGNDTTQDGTAITAPSPDLNVTSTHSGNFTQGQTGATYTLNVTNAGTLPTSGQVTVSDNFPFGLTVTAMSGTGWTCSVFGFAGTCTRSDALPTSSSYPPLTATVNVSPTAPAQGTNTVTVSGGGEQDSGDSFNDPTTIIQLPDMAINSSLPGLIVAGSTGVIWTLTANNVGNVPTSAPVTVTASLTTGATATAISGTGWNCTFSTLTCTRSDVLAASGVYPVITVTINYSSTATSVTQTATVSGGGEVNTANDSITVSFTPVPAVSLSTPSPTATITAGSAAFFTLLVSSQLPGTVNFSCTGLPQGANCAFLPPSLSGPAFTFDALTINTTGPTIARLVSPGSKRPSPWYMLLPVIMGMLGIAAGARKKKTLGWAIRVGTVTGIMLVAGCGGHKPPPPVVTPPGTYTITIVANNASANVQSSLPITLIVR